MTSTEMSRAITVFEQRDALVSFFPESLVWANGARLFWIHEVRPSPLSGTYKIAIDYSVASAPKTFVLSPKLALASGAKRLPHVYNSELQQLCLFHPHFQTWRPSDFLVKTIVPWALEWLLHYEIWLATKEWHGGGIAHKEEPED